MKDDGHEEASEGVIIPFPDPSGSQTNAGPFCEKCEKRRYARNESRGKCGHPTFFAGFVYCGRCAILGQICRVCGNDISGLMRRLAEERNNRNRPKKPGDKSRMKVLKP